MARWDIVVDYNQMGFLLAVSKLFSLVTLIAKQRT